MRVYPVAASRLLGTAGLLLMMGLVVYCAAAEMRGMTGGGPSPEIRNAALSLSALETSAKPADPRVSVVKYGAKGDGKKDDTEAIQAAVNAVGAKGGGTVYFPKGVYRVSDSIVVRHDEVMLEGEGWESEIRIVKHPKRVIVIEGSSRNAVRNLKISLGVTGVSRDDEDEGVYVTSRASHFRIEGILGEGKGIMVRGGVSHGVIRGNTIRNTLADGIHLTGRSQYIEVEDNELENTGDDAIAVVSYERDGALTKYVKIVGNSVRNSHARGIAHVGGYQVEIRDNRIDGTSSSGILVDRDINVRTFAAVHTSIADNVVSRAGTFGDKKGNQFGIEISHGGGGDVTIEDNRVTGAAGRGMSVSARNAVIRRNVVTGSGDSGLQVDASGCVIVGNLFERNGTFGFYSAGGDGLTIKGNRFADNNERNARNIDNFVLKDSRGSVIKGNISVETRKTARLERAFELLGSCRDTVFEDNKAEGTRLGIVKECTP